MGVSEAKVASAASDLRRSGSNSSHGNMATRENPTGSTLGWSQAWHTAMKTGRWGNARAYNSGYRAAPWRNDRACSKRSRRIGWGERSTWPPCRRGYLFSAAISVKPFFHCFSRYRCTIVVQLAMSPRIGHRHWYVSRQKSRWLFISTPSGYDGAILRLFTRVPVMLTYTCTCVYVQVHSVFRI